MPCLQQSKDGRRDNTPPEVEDELWWHCCWKAGLFLTYFPPSIGVRACWTQQAAQEHCDSESSIYASVPQFETPLWEPYKNCFVQVLRNFCMKNIIATYYTMRRFFWLYNNVARINYYIRFKPVYLRVKNSVWCSVHRSWRASTQSPSFAVGKVDSSCTGSFSASVKWSLCPEGR